MSGSRCTWCPCGDREKRLAPGSLDRPGPRPLSVHCLLPQQLLLTLARPLQQRPTLSLIRLREILCKVGVRRAVHLSHFMSLYRRYRQREPVAHGAANGRRWPPGLRQARGRAGGESWARCLRQRHPPDRIIRLLQPDEFENNAWALRHKLFHTCQIWGQRRRRARRR